MIHKSVLNGVVILLISSFAASHSVADEAILQQQLEMLKQQVDALEKRLGALEGDTRFAIEQSKAEAPPVNPGDPADLSNWSRLGVGLDYDEVRELLGEPVSINKGVMELWYYSDQGLKGPHVKFLFKKVHLWKGPLK